MISDKDTSTNTNEDSEYRPCPECGMNTIKGMPGGRDATCKNCGYKDPCCYD
ncbi:MAG: hypothetical protein Q8P72_01015 [Candidatus Roizmanbacteria bacterium]|nr:hypothetical protein [Candidatus Roizmanbacteria bacterium]